MNIKKNNCIRSLCPVCHYTLAVPFFNGEKQPLATLGWPQSTEEAIAMSSYELNYVLCPRCTHIWNRSFTYDAIPYTNNPNRMFNKGNIWQGHLNATIDSVISTLPPNPTVIDIGCGEGHFVRTISQKLQGQGRFIGFDPNSTPESGVGVEFHSRYFDPLEDLPNLKPDLLVMRHVLEHLTEPLEFIEQMAWAASKLNKPSLFFAEVPCIDRIIESNRLVDFFYEHPSQFTTESFRFLMDRGGDLLKIEHGYNSEVIYGLTVLNIPGSYKELSIKAKAFFDLSLESRKNINTQLTELVGSGKKVAIWGGTGKAAAFIHFYKLDKVKFPLVVDSDPDKVGTYVSKTGQLIQHKDVLKSELIDVLIIPPQWRAKDILEEMARENIKVDRILIEHFGRLIDFFSEPHPYK